MVYYPEQNIPGISTLTHELRANTYWRDVRLEYTNNQVIYKGSHRKNTAATSDAAWTIVKYTWSGSDLIRIQGPILGAWDDRATLGWS